MYKAYWVILVSVEQSVVPPVHSDLRLLLFNLVLIVLSPHDLTFFTIGLLHKHHTHTHTHTHTKQTTTQNGWQIVIQIAQSH